MDIKDDEFKDIFIGEQADFDIKFVREYISQMHLMEKSILDISLIELDIRNNVKLSDIAEVSKNVNWSGMHYVRK